MTAEEEITIEEAYKQSNEIIQSLNRPSTLIHTIIGDKSHHHCPEIARSHSVVK